MNYDDAKLKLETFPFKYVIIGFKSDGKRGIPPTYEMDVVLVSDDNLFEELKKFQEARVLTASEIATPDHWKTRMKKYFDSKTEKEEKELLNKLKQKYPE